MSRTLTCEDMVKLLNLHSVRSLHRVKHTPGFPKPLAYKKRGQVWSKAQVMDYLS